MSALVHNLAIPSSTRHLKKVRQFVLGHLANAGVQDAVVSEIKQAVDEACANVIEHAYRNDPEHELDLMLRIDDRQITIRIRDSGIPFDERSYKEPDVRALTKRGKAGGLGVHIMRRLMDDVQYRIKGDTNEIRLTKLRQGVLDGD